ncbi:MAG: DUF3618 domain-containing protein [Actinomycetota bacterium]|nr:DUF3618 domain-containing protein [Actinomycetota bacterium]
MAQDPAAIQREIERTRAQLASTIDAISDRVQPRNLADKAKSRARDTVGQVRGKQPGPGGQRAAIGGAAAGAVTALLALRRRRSRRRLTELRALRRELRRRQRRSDS